MKKILKKDLIFIIFLLIAIFSFVNIKPLDDLDELWNYNFARNILDGLFPYKDFNIIVTPFASMVSAVFLKIFGNELIVMRLVCAVLFTLIFYLTFKIFEKLFGKNKIYKGIAIFSVLIFFYIYIDNFRIDYNFFSIFLLLIALNMELSFISNLNENSQIQLMGADLRKNFLIGVLLGLIVLTKQSIGAIAIFIGIFYTILLCQNKKDIKVLFKIIGFRILGAFLPCLIFLIYLLYNNLLQDFLSYAVFRNIIICK